MYFLVLELIGDEVGSAGASLYRHFSEGASEVLRFAGEFAEISRITSEGKGNALLYFSSI